MKTIAFLILSFISIAVFGGEKPYRLYPNPCSDFVYLTNDDGLEKLKQVKIFDSIGKLQYNKEYSDINNPIISLDIQDFPAGYYYVHLIQVNGTVNTMAIQVK